MRSRRRRRRAPLVRASVNPNRGEAVHEPRPERGGGRGRDTARGSLRSLVLRGDPSFALILRLLLFLAPSRGFGMFVAVAEEGAVLVPPRVRAPALAPAPEPPEPQPELARAGLPRPRRRRDGRRLELWTTRAAALRSAASAMAAPTTRDSPYTAPAISRATAGKWRCIARTRAPRARSGSSSYASRRPTSTLASGTRRGDRPGTTNSGERCAASDVCGGSGDSGAARLFDEPSVLERGVFSRAFSFSASASKASISSSRTSSSSS